MDAPTAFPSGAHVQILGLLRAHGVWNGAPEGGTGSRSALRPTDERMEILGLPAVKHEEIVDVRVVREVWLVDWPAVTGETAMRTVLADIDAFLTDGRAASLSPELAQLTQSFRIDFPVRSTRFDRMYEEMKEIAGSVLEPVDTSTLGLRIRVESEATEVRKGPIPAGTFDPPAGYKKKRDP